MRLVLLGPSGAGKGTQAQRLSHYLGVPHVSTGDLFRRHVELGSPLGERARSFLDAGELVPDDVTAGMLAQRLAEPDAQRGFLLDGFPRTLPQAEVLSAMLDRKGLSLRTVLELQVPEDVLTARLLGRGRADDTKEVILHRQAVYRSQTASLLSYYRDVLVSVEADGTIDDITTRIWSALHLPA